MRRFLRIMPWIIIAAGLGLNLWFLIVHGKWLIDGDLSAEMVLADHLNKTGQIISKSWNYSTELRVFQTQWFYRVGLILSPKNWHAARVIAAFLMQIVLVCLVLSCSYRIGLKKYAPWAAALFVWPFGRWYLVYALYGMYYLTYMFFELSSILVLTGIYRLLANEGKREKSGQKNRLLLFGYYIGGIFCGFASGLNGVKQTKDFYVPLLLSVAACLFLKEEKMQVNCFSDFWKKCKKEIIFSLTAVIFVFANFSGYFVNQFYLSRHYRFEKYDDLFWSSVTVNRFSDILTDFIKLFGYNLNNTIPVISFSGLASALGIVFGICIVLSVLHRLIWIKEMALFNQLIIFVFFFSFAINSIIYCFSGTYKAYYWLPLIPFALMILLMEFRALNIHFYAVKTIFALSVLPCMFLMSSSTIKQEIEAPLFGFRGVPETAEWLVENGLTEGYAQFWTSAAIREASNGKVQTWSTWYVNDSLVVYNWLQETDKRMTEPQGKCFLIINLHVDGDPGISVYTGHGLRQPDFYAGDLYVYVYDSVDELHAMEKITE